VFRFGPLLLVALLAAGCAGKAPTHFSLAKSRECLRDKGARIAAPKGDFVAVASTASDGTFRAYLDDGNFVTLSFGANPTEAQQIATGYDRFHAKNVGVADILFTAKNVTLLWKLHPASDDSDLVTGCLK
jgi:hypothetical protein